MSNCSRDIKPIDASPEDIAKALVRSANKKRDRKLGKEKGTKQGDKRKRRLGGG